MPAPVRVVVSFAPEDDPLRRELEAHLAGLVRDGTLHLWSRHDVRAGENPQKLVAEHLDAAGLVLLLVSPSFIASPKCMDEEVPRAMARAASVVPILLRACDLHGAPFAHLKMLPDKDRPLASCTDRDAAWLEVVQGIRDLVEALPARHAPHGTPHNLPPRRLFVGRTDELKLVDEALAREGRSSIAQQAAVWGLGGVGKTALALRYAYDALDAGTYPGGIFWVVAEGRPLDIVARLAGILREYAAGLLPNIPDQTPPAKVAEIVRRTLEDLPLPSLLVLDNVSEQWGAELLPGRQARVLMTLRDRRLGVGKEIELEVLSYEDARALALDLAGKVPENKAEEEALQRVMNEQLGGLAVAVEVAARAVKAWARSWIEYEMLLATQPRDALDAPEDRSRNYEPGVFAALDLSIDRCGENERTLLEGAAVFAPDALPLEWMYAAAGLSTENIPARRALGALEALALVKVDDKARTLSIHRLVHARVRGRAEAKAWDVAGKRAVEWVENWIKPAVGPGKEQMDAVEARREHIKEVLGLAEHVGSVRELCEIADRLATHLQHRGEYREARPLFELVLANAEKTYGPGDPQVAASLSNLGGVLKDLGDLEQARSCFERALAMGEKTYGRASRVVGIRKSNLATVLRRLGKLDEARSMAEDALAIARMEYGSEDAETATRMSNLALVLHDMGKLPEARSLLELALAVDKEAYGEEHSYVAKDLMHLAVVLKDQGDPVAALPMAERAVAIAEKVLPPTHPDLTRHREDLAAVLAALGKRPPPEG